MPDHNEKNKLGMLELKEVKDLLGESFFIPDFQRGYRWTRKEVKDLLSDLKEFFDDNNKKDNEDYFYCMQPLVVDRKEKNDKEVWEVIDGQQRLTTLYLILRYLCPDKEGFEISYQSPKFYTAGSGQSKVDIGGITKDQMLENIDFYHLYNASQEIKEFFENDKAIDSKSFAAAVLGESDTYPIKFIWYDVTDEIKSKNITAEEKFSELNIGKISLTNAELIKALLLNTVNKRAEASEIEPYRLAYEWDEIEHSLQNDEFWSFIYGKKDDEYETRIELIFDVIKKKDEYQTDDFFTYDEYLKDIKDNKSVAKIWKKITDTYNLFKGWYEDKKLYHIIGYLRYLKKDIVKIIEIFNEQTTKDNEEFYKKLKETIYNEVLLDEKKNIELGKLNYGNRDKVYKVLLLFNILSILETEKDSVRFSFRDFYAETWDIEHIRSQTPKDLSGCDRIKWVICNIQYFFGEEYDEDKYKKNSSDYIAEVSGLVVKEELKDIQDALVELLKGDNANVASAYDLIRNFFGQKEDSDFTYTDAIGNLVLLDKGTNRGYKNAFFPVKRQWIFRQEHKKGIYILPCTRNVFSKNYSKTLDDLMNWNTEDAEAYENEIKRVFDAFMP